MFFSASLNISVSNINWINPFVDLSSLQASISVAVVCCNIQNRRFIKSSANARKMSSGCESPFNFLLKNYCRFCTSNWDQLPKNLGSNVVTFCNPASRTIAPSLHLVTTAYIVFCDSSSIGRVDRANAMYSSHHVLYGFFRVRLKRPHFISGKHGCVTVQSNDI